MRSLAWSALILLVAGGLYLLRSPEPRPAEIEPGPPSDTSAGTRGEGPSARALATTSTLALRVQAPDGSVPEGAEVGYEALHRERWAAADARGARTFTDVPVGPVYVLARAPGYLPARQRRVVASGTTESAVLVVHRTE